jgi:hypothetical protein
MRELQFNQALIDLFNDVRYNWRVNAVVLGGTSGSGGGYGSPPGGFVGQLPQSQVTGDTDEFRVITSGSVSSLVDNLNRMRYWLTNQISGSAPVPTFPGQIWIDGSSGSTFKIRNEADNAWITITGGGGGMLDPSSPLDVGGSAIVGTSGSSSHGDHVHRGVHGVYTTPNVLAYGNIDLVAGTGIAITQSSGSFTFSSTSGSAAGHLHGTSRWSSAGGTTFDLFDVADYLEFASDNGAIVDPFTYSLSGNGTQIVFDSAITAGHIVTTNYVIAQI